MATGGKRKTGSGRRKGRQERSAAIVASSTQTPASTHKRIVDQRTKRARGRQDARMPVELSVALNRVEKLPRRLAGRAGRDVLSPLSESLSSLPGTSTMSVSISKCGDRLEDAFEGYEDVFEGAGDVDKSSGRLEIRLLEAVTSAAGEA